MEKIRQKKDKAVLDPGAVKTLQEKGLIEPVGRTNAKGFMLSKTYFAFTNQPAAYTKQKDPDIASIWLQVFNHMSKFNKAKILDFESLFAGILTREQVKYYIYLFVSAGILDRKGVGRGIYYDLSAELLGNANTLQLGFDKIKEISN